MKRTISLIISALVLLASCSDHEDVQAVYYGEFLDATPGMNYHPDVYYPDVIRNIVPHETKTIKDTLVFTGTTTRTSHSFYTLTVNEKRSKLDIEMKMDGDSIFIWKKKEKTTYKAGTYKVNNGIEIIEVTNDGIYIYYSNEEKRLNRKLNNYTETYYSSTSKSEERPFNDVKLQLQCTGNSLHFVGEKMEYKAIVNENICILKELSPEQNEFELDKIK